MLPTVSDARAIAPTLRQRIENDPWAKALGIEFLDLRRGHCKVRLQLQAHMVNLQGQPHGGVIFSLADVAFGAACNSHGRDAVALSVTINYLARAVPDAALVAEAREIKQGRRAGFYRLDVATEDGRRIASAQAVAHRRTS
jgi:acyl-CoA thioesterase